MQGGGLIYVAIIALWAIVLVPMWLRRHDRASELRGVDRFNNAMRSLHRRNAHALEESRSRNVEVAMAKHGNGSLAYQPARKASNRRALVLMALVSLLALTLVVAFIGVVPVWSVLIPALALGTFLVASAMTSGHRIPVPQQRGASEPRRTSTSSARREVRRYDDNFFDNQFDENAWEAAPTPPLPTYVTAPRASAVPRGIDRANDGEWTGAAMVEQAKAAQEARTNHNVASARGRHADVVAAFQAELDDTAEIQLPRVAGE